MKSFRGSANSLVNTFITLSTNASASNGTLGTMLINEEHKYLILKFFDNERAVSLVTVGGGTLATLTSFSSGATSGTLTTAWPNVSAQQLVTFSNSQQRTVNFNQNSTVITWQPPLTSSAGTASITTTGVQFYPLPANVSKIKNSTITIGQLVYTPYPVQSIQEWTKLNALPYTSDIPAYFFIYQNQIGFWPIPSSSGNVVTLQCQIVVPDMTYSDYSTGTISLSQGSNVVTGASTSWSSVYPTGVDLTHVNLFLTPTPPDGDGIPYQIQSFSSATTALLTKPIVSTPRNSTIGYIIGQYPYLSPDFHDLIVYRALRIYFSSIVKNPEQYNLFNGLSDEKLKLMTAYLANKQVNVDLSASPTLRNPNLFLMGTTQ